MERIGLDLKEAKFLKACQLAQVSDSVDFPSAADLKSSKERLEAEKIKLSEAHDHVKALQGILFDLQINRRSVPMEWTTQQTEESVACFSVVQRRNWLRHG
eukprot:3450055-Rhodomonas_salina.1